MSKKIDSKLFSLSYTELIQISKNLCVVLTRDLSDLSIFGLTAPLITNLTTLTTTFENSRTDLEYEGDVMIKTDAKNVLSEQALEQIRFMNVRAEAAFGLNSVIYETFRFGNINEMPDRDVLETLRRIARTADQHIAALTAYGVNPALITSLEDLADEFSTALTEQEQTMDARRLAASARVDNANAIYGFVSNYANFGKKFYANSDPAKYADYVIYDTTSPGTLTAPTGLSFYFQSTTFSWEPVENATGYKLFSSLDNVVFSEIYSGPETSVEYTPIQSGYSYFKVQARNDGGLGPFSEVLAQGYYPGTVLPAPENLVLQLAAGSPNTLQLSFSEVASATSYGINRNISEISAPVGPFSFVTNVHEPIYIENIIPGHRFYFNVTASNSHQWSGVSVNVFLDVPE